MGRAIPLSRVLAVVLLLTGVCWSAQLNSGPPHYVGPETCALCHQDIAASQHKTPMAETWQGLSTDWLPQIFQARITEPPDPPAFYNLFRQRSQFLWTTAVPTLPDATLPIEFIVGGRRHGLGFLSSIAELDGMALARPALIQDRYAWSFTRKALVLAPGCAAARPSSFESAFGIVLSPTFEARCLSCHGQPKTLGAGSSGGVHCESCHGPGSQHIQPLAKSSPTHNIVNPGKLKADESIGVCAQCHVGLTKFADPSPDDLLVANQVRAITGSECFIQSRKGFTCTTCHNAHETSSQDEARSIAACLNCHSNSAARHAAICPVNAREKCLGCHMPSVEMGPLHLVDHLIRVHPEQDVPPPPESSQSAEPRRSQVQPLREFLRVTCTDNLAAGEKAKLRLAQGEDFYAVAREMSVDSSAPIGGYLGPKWLSQMDAAQAAAVTKLDFGQTTPLIADGKQWIILQRLPRDFEWQARQLQYQAGVQLAGGDTKGAIEKSRQALKIYPRLLRALTFIGTTMAENGNVQRASEILGLATRLYPEDSEASFEYGVMLGTLGRHPEELQAYRKALELEPDLLAVYSKLGMALYSGGEKSEAIDIFRKGLQINPLSAELYHDLGLVLGKCGDMAGAKRALTLAAKIDPDYASLAPRP